MTMRSITTHTTAGLPSLALCPPRHRRPSPSATPVRPCPPSRGRLLLPPPIRSRKSEHLITISGIKKTSSLVLQCGALMASVAQPVLAVTGKNNNFDEDLTSTLIQAGIVAFFYFLVMPPVIMNWLRLRWYKRKFFEMYFQFMFVFIFFPGLLLWAPFLNFRRMPRDPTMKYPWDKPKDLSMNNP
uniref:NAD(P)H-quinone oxidoreductase subunit L n=1 Tax=Anthurium amnicola TaxID=1678845 RepID=A0A1D1XG31_9ARAE